MKIINNEIIKRFERTTMLIGEDNMEKLLKSRIVLFGIGGVGSYVAEALARSGIGNLMLVDNDTVNESNINRQIIALEDTIGLYKTEVMRMRISQINPYANVTVNNSFVTTENTEAIITEDTDFIIDAIDTISAKIAIIERASKINKNIISSMGMANKLDPEQIQISDLSNTSVCPLAKIMRKELRQRGIEKITVCYSKELPIKPLEQEERHDMSKNQKRSLGSISFVPSTAGLMIAGWVIRKIISGDIKNG